MRSAENRVFDRILIENDVSRPWRRKTFHLKSGRGDVFFDRAWWDRISKGLGVWWRCSDGIQVSGPWREMKFLIFSKLFCGPVRAKMRGKRVPFFWITISRKKEWESKIDRDRWAERGRTGESVQWVPPATIGPVGRGRARTGAKRRKKKFFLNHNLQEETRITSRLDRWAERGRTKEQQRVFPVQSWIRKYNVT